MGDNDLGLVCGIVEDVCRSVNAEVTFLATDANVHGGSQRARGGRHVKIKGRGGTNMCVGIEYAMGKVKPRPDVVVVCTDCDTDWPQKRPATRVIICAIGASESLIAKCPEWATVIEVEIA